MAEIREAMAVEQIRSRSGAETANEADKALPHRLDADNDAGLLQKYGISPEDLCDKFGGGSPAVG